MFLCEHNLVPLDSAEMFSRLLFVTFFMLASRANANECREMTFVHQFTDKSLRRHLIRSFETSNCELCQIECFLEKKCVSYNCGNNTCDLNSSDHIFHPKDLVEDKGKIYHATENACKDHRCPSNATCLNDFTDKGYKCECPFGLTGDNCDKDVDECLEKKHNCSSKSICQNNHGSFNCKCRISYTRDGITCHDTLATSCRHLKQRDSFSTSGIYDIDPDGAGGLAPFSVFCDMSDKAGVGVTVISHDSESRTLVDGCERPGCYLRELTYTGASLTQLASLTRVSNRCEQFIKYECYHSRLHSKIKQYSWLVSRERKKMRYWGGASRDSNKCACGMSNTCANRNKSCNCDMNDNIWREDSGLLTHKDDLPVSQLRFGDISQFNLNDEKGYHTLGKLKCS